MTLSPCLSVGGAKGLGFVSAPTSVRTNLWGEVGRARSYEGVFDVWFDTVLTYRLGEVYEGSLRGFEVQANELVPSLLQWRVGEQWKGGGQTSARPGSPAW